LFRVRISARHGRTLAICFEAGEDLNATMVLTATSSPKSAGIPHATRAAPAAPGPSAQSHVLKPQGEPSVIALRLLKNGCIWRMI
jgi:hypothetical protein